jgi:hypothetical protein
MFIPGENGKIRFIECSPFLRLRCYIMETKKILREKRKIVKLGNVGSVEYYW